jgi:hypothetical protein
MRLLRPAFQEGIHWRKLTSAERNGRPWKYKLLEDVTIRFEQPVCFGTYYLYDGDGTCWGVISPRSILICAPYAWNGSSCSPDWRVLLASLPHDLFYQFSGVARFPLSRMFCDLLFFTLAQSPLAPLYIGGLVIGGWTCWGQHEPGARITSP